MTGITMRLKLRLPKNTISELHSYAEQCLPSEAAALLFGRFSKDTVEVVKLELVQNALKSSVGFEIDPEEEYRLIMEHEVHREEIVAIFHSHPAPPRPSARDLENMRLNPVVWLIASRSSGVWESKAFHLQGDKLHEIEVVQ